MSITAECFMTHLKMATRRLFRISQTSAQPSCQAHTLHITINTTDLQRLNTRAVAFAKFHSAHRRPLLGMLACKEHIRQVALRIKPNLPSVMIFGILISHPTRRKALVGASSKHCETSRRFVDSCITQARVGDTWHTSLRHSLLCCPLSLPPAATPW